MVVTFIHGPMTAGKTNRILKSYKLAKRYRLGVTIVKPIIDVRNNANAITTHDGKVLEDDVYVFGKDKLPQKKKLRMVMVDESQFFSIDEVKNIIKRCDENDTSFLTFFGLLNDYAQEPFPTSEFLYNYSHRTEELVAECAVCDEEAKHTQRLVNGLPAPIGAKILIGGTENYEARCDSCYVHPSIVEELF